MACDTTDLRLLRLLDRHSRMSNADAARALKLSEHAVASRIERLQTNGVIQRFVTFINSPALGFTHYKVYLKFLAVKEETETRLLRFLCAEQNVLWVVSMSGRYDISFSLLARSVLEYAELYRRLEAQFGRFIREKNVVTVIMAPGYSREYLVLDRDAGKEARIERFYGSTAPLIQIGEIEHTILRELSQNARLPLTEVALHTGLTLDIVRYRLKKLEETKVVAGYTVLLDLAKLGCEYYVVFLYFHGITKALEARLRRFAESQGNVLFFVKVIGEHDFQIEIEARGVAELDRFLGTLRKTFAENLRDIQVLRITKEHKFDYFPFEKTFI